MSTGTSGAAEAVGIAPSAEPLRRRVRGRVLRGLTRTAGVVPTPWLTRTLAWATHLAPIGRYADRTLRNLELALGDETTPAERTAIARGVRGHAARQLAEWTRLARGRREAHAFLDRTVEADASLALLEELYRERRGVIVVTAHLGNWECLAASLAQRGFDGDVVGRTRARDSANRWLVDLRRAYGVETIPQDAPARRLVRALHDGRLVGLLCDLEVRRLDGVFVPFFGRPTLTMTAPAALARATGRPLVPVFCVAHEDRYRLTVEEPLELDATLDRRAAVVDLCARMNRRFEERIRATPEQWAWHQERWRTRPDPSATANRDDPRDPLDRGSDRRRRRSSR